MILNALCMNDISTDDHTDCLKRGGILRCPLSCTDFESRTEGIQDTVMTAIDEAYKRGYRDGQMDLRKEQEVTQRYWGKKPEKSCVTCSKLYLDCDKVTCTLNDHAHWIPKQTDEIKVGDEVMYHEDRGIIVNVANGDNTYFVLCCDYSCLIRTNRENLVKTGRHFPQISEVLKQMREDKTE